jgi:Xaa-Pro aminopeptidase
VLKTELERLFGKAKTVAMEYSPQSNIPYVSTVDGGTIDLVRSLGVKVVSSGDLLQLFLTWTPKQLANHKKAAKVLAATKDAAFSLIQERISQRKPITEYELQQSMLRFMNEQGMETDHAPTVAFNESVGIGHYSPSPKRPKALKPGPVLIDLWCKVPGDNPYADIAWVAHWGTPSAAYMRAFAAVVKARDAGADLLQARFASSQPIRGYEVDRMVRQTLAEAGYKDVMRRRTGHSLGISAVHGEVVHFDDFETFDDRLVLPGLGFTIEPGFCQGGYGGHSEINVFTHPDRVEVTTVVQREAVVFL